MAEAQATASLAEPSAPFAQDPRAVLKKHCRPWGAAAHSAACACPIQYVVSSISPSPHALKLYADHPAQPLILVFQEPGGRSLSEHRVLSPTTSIS